MIMYAPDVNVLHVRCAHREVHEAIRRVHCALDTGNGRRVPARAISEMEHFRHSLSRHFAEEAEGGCLDEAVYRCPRLYRVKEKLQDRHAALLNSVDRIVCRMRSPWFGRQDVVRSFDGLADTIHSHFEVESRIVEEAFGFCVE